MARVTGVPQLQARLHALGSTNLLMKRLGLAAVREQKILVHRKTGTTGRSIRLASATATTAVTTVGFAGRFLEFGTRGGTIITPKAARALAWGGARRLSGSLRSGSKPTIFAMRVVRGATKAYPFMIPWAKIAAQKYGTDVIVDVWNSAA